MMSVFVHVLSCVNASSRAQADPRGVLETGAEQLNPAKDGLQENVRERTSGGRKGTHALGPMGRSHGTERSEHRRREEKRARSLGQENCDHPRDD